MRRHIGRARRTLRRFKIRSGPRVLILLYHRITTLHSDPWLLSVTPQHFAEHLEVVRQYAHPLRLQRLAQELAGNKLPHRSVVITFDDGYADNLYEAKPVLEHYDVPATIFLTTGNIGSEREFWWDEVDRLLLQPGKLPKTLHLSIEGTRYRWELDEAADYSEAACRKHRHWKAWEIGPSLRHSLYRSLWELLHRVTEEERQRVLAELLKWADAEPVGRPTHRTLSLAEVNALTEGELIEVGAHTVTHPVLSALPGISQQKEILTSKEHLQKVLDRPVVSFAYPFGRRSDYNAETLAIVRQAGFDCCCSNYAGVVKRNTDPYQLPRVHVRDCDADEFTQQLSWWLDG